MKCGVISFAFTAAVGLAQAQNTGVAFQNIYTFNDRTVTLQSVSRDIVTGHPFSGTEERHSLQVLGDGTRIETSSSDKFYRDDQGRTRIEREDGTVVINDPVRGQGVEMKDGKVLGNSTFSKRGTSFSFTTTSEGNRSVDGAKLEQAKAALDSVRPRVAVAVNGNPVEAKLAAEAEAKAAVKEENLGYQAMNGVSAQGNRSTTTIPAGSIGNDRPIAIVSERWVSPELQMTIKSSNKDPRFGESTYELTNIVVGAPDPSLFQFASRQ
jgi:hypothetical protein